MITKFRKKPIVIEAMQFDGKNLKDVEDFCGEVFVRSHVFNEEHQINARYSKPAILTLEGIMEVNVNDWIIKGIKEEFYPCKPDVFEATYEKVED